MPCLLKDLLKHSRCHRDEECGWWLCLMLSPCSLPWALSVGVKLWMNQDEKHGSGVTFTEKE